MPVRWWTRWTFILNNLNYYNKSVISSTNPYLNIIDNEVYINNFNVGTYDIDLIASFNDKNNIQKFFVV